MMTSATTAVVTSAMTQDNPPKIGRKSDENPTKFDGKKNKNLRMMLQRTPSFVAMAMALAMLQRY
jgi:hypothetical protein